MFLLLGFVFITVLVIFIYLKLKAPLRHWEDKQVPYSKPWLIFGNLAPIFFRRKHFSVLIQSYYEKFSTQRIFANFHGNVGQHNCFLGRYPTVKFIQRWKDRPLRYFGFFEFSAPTLFVRDLDLIKSICINDFDKFTDHTNFLPPVNDDLWTNGLHNLKGDEWHQMRSILSPAFTGNKMKAMFPLILECADHFVDHFKKQPGTITLQLRDAFTRFTNDAIASCAFGIKCDSLNDKTNEFFLNGKEAFDFTGFKALKFFGASISPTLMKWLKVKFYARNISDFFYRIVKETIQYRKQTGIYRPDLIHLLMQAQQGKLPIQEHFDADPDFKDTNWKEIKKKHMKPIKLTDELLTAQAVIFFFGAYDSVAMVLCTLAYELAVNVDVQRKLVKEIDDTFNACNGKITYEAITGMKYLDMVVSETLRLWTPGIILSRKCVKPYTIDPVLPGEKPLKLDVGSTVVVPVNSIHRDERYFQNPTKFDPERFSDENKHNIVSGTYLPFGAGPRFCIGNRFALMETKIFFFCILRKFLIIPVAKSEIPFEPRMDTVLIHSKNGHWFGFEHRN